MLEVKNLEVTIGDRTLIESLTFNLNGGEKLAIIGEEGDGKSTLLKAFLGLCDYAIIKGHVNFKGHTVGYLKQSISEAENSMIVLDYLFEKIDAYYSKINGLYSYFSDLKIDKEILKRSIGSLSGGEKVKVGILKILLEDDDILFLDEPTNDLDIETLEWLEDFINRSRKTIVYVSHDETLLSRTATSILHIESIDKKKSCRCTFSKSSYDLYVANRLRSIKKQTEKAHIEHRDYEKKKRRLNRILQKVEYRQNTISRQDPFGAKILKKKMHTLKSQEKKLEKIDLTEVPDVEENINFFFEDVKIPKGKVISRVVIPVLEIESQVLARDIEFVIVGDVHIVITGKNGVGKTTLIKHIYEELKDREDINVGYMPQNYEDVLGDYEFVLDYIASKDIEDIKRARTRLSSMNFTYEEISGKIKDLSNGSKAKLILMKLVLEKCDILILDEPTRNVSPLSNPVIRRVLNEFGGTIISISHDRKYIEEVADKIYQLSSDGIREVYF